MYQERTAAKPAAASAYTAYTTRMMPNALPTVTFFGLAAENPIASSAIRQKANRSTDEASETSHRGQSLPTSAPRFEATMCSTSTVSGFFRNRMTIASRPETNEGMYAWATTAMEVT